LKKQKTIKKPKKRERSKWELELAFQIKCIGLPIPTEEHKFLEKRRFRFDFAWIDRKIACECDGMPFGGRHTKGKGFINDCEKFNLATLAGWRILRFVPDTIKDGSAIAMLEEILKQ